METISVVIEKNSTRDNEEELKSKGGILNLIKNFINDSFTVIPYEFPPEEKKEHETQTARILVTPKEARGHDFFVDNLNNSCDFESQKCLINLTYSYNISIYDLFNEQDLIDQVYKCKLVEESKLKYVGDATINSLIKINEETLISPVSVKLTLFDISKTTQTEIIVSYGSFIKSRLFGILSEKETSQVPIKNSLNRLLIHMIYRTDWNLYLVKPIQQSNDPISASIQFSPSIPKNGVVYFRKTFRSLFLLYYLENFAQLKNLNLSSFDSVNEFEISAENWSIITDCINEIKNGIKLNQCLIKLTEFPLLEQEEISCSYKIKICSLK